MALNRASLDKLRDTVGGDADLAELIDSFLDEGATLMEALIAAYASGDLAVVNRSAHSLKSNGRDFGAEEFAGLCARIEAAGRSGAAPDAADVTLAKAALDEAFGELRAFRAAIA